MSPPDEHKRVGKHTGNGNIHLFLFRWQGMNAPKNKRAQDGPGFRKHVLEKSGKIPKNPDNPGNSGKIRKIWKNPEKSQRNGKKPENTGKILENPERNQKHLEKSRTN